MSHFSGRITFTMPRRFKQYDRVVNEDPEPQEALRNRNKDHPDNFHNNKGRHCRLRMHQRKQNGPRPGTLGEYHGLKESANQYVCNKEGTRAVKKVIVNSARTHKVRRNESNITPPDLSKPSQRKSYWGAFGQLTDQYYVSNYAKQRNLPREDSFHWRHTMTRHPLMADGQPRLMNFWDTVRQGRQMHLPAGQLSNFAPGLLRGANRLPHLPEAEAIQQTRGKRARSPPPIEGSSRVTRSSAIPKTTKQTPRLRPLSWPYHNLHPQEILKIPGPQRLQSFHDWMKAHGLPQHSWPLSNQPLQQDELLDIINADRNNTNFTHFLGEVEDRLELMRQQEEDNQEEEQEQPDYGDDDAYYPSDEERYRRQDSPLAPPVQALKRARGVRDLGTFFRESGVGPTSSFGYSGVVDSQGNLRRRAFVKATKTIPKKKN